jgi:hypothetical protein
MRKITRAAVYFDQTSSKISDPGDVANPSRAPSLFMNCDRATIVPHATTSR